MTQWLMAVTYDTGPPLTIDQWARAAEGIDRDSVNEPGAFVSSLKFNHTRIIMNILASGVKWEAEARALRVATRLANVLQIPTNVKIQIEVHQHESSAS